jgi:hypothetical protein
MSSRNGEVISSLLRGRTEDSDSIPILPHHLHHISSEQLGVSSSEFGYLHDQIETTKIVQALASHFHALSDQKRDGLINDVEFENILNQVFSATSQQLQVSIPELMMLMTQPHQLSHTAEESTMNSSSSSSLHHHHHHHHHQHQHHLHHEPIHPHHQSHHHHMRHHTHEMMQISHQNDSSKIPSSGGDLSSDPTVQSSSSQLVTQLLNASTSAATVDDGKYVQHQQRLADEDAGSEKSKTHMCTIPGCGQAFAAPSKLARHIFAHSGERPYKCDEPGCNKSFTESGSLTTHRRQHTGERLYACIFPGCNKTFIAPSKLARHQRTHTGEKPFACLVDGCGKSFTEKSDLNSHSRTHTGENLHACNVPGCDKVFVKPWCLTMHARTHTGERPFVCEIESCGKTFVWAGDLKTHRRSHSGERPHQCKVPGCLKAYIPTQATDPLRARLIIVAKHSLKLDLFESILARILRIDLTCAPS